MKEINDMNDNLYQINEQQQQERVGPFDKRRSMANPSPKSNRFLNPFPEPAP